MTMIMLFVFVLYSHRQRMKCSHQCEDCCKECRVNSTGMKKSNPEINQSINQSKGITLLSLLPSAAQQISSPNPWRQRSTWQQYPEESFPSMEWMQPKNRIQ